MYQTVNRYELLEKLGAGSMGIVYRAYDRLRDETIALKQIRFEDRPDNQEDLSQLRFFLAQEFRTLSSLRHPHIVKVLDYGFDQEQKPYFTMEYLQAGESLVEASKKLSYEDRLQAIMDLLQAVAYLHRHKILHRDLKPDNIIISQKQLRVLDFGLAVFKDLMPKTDELVGTLTYMAPEALGGQVDERSDLYAVGLIAYEILSGSYPYRQGDVQSLLSDILHRQPQLELIQANPEVQRFIGSLLVKDVDNRIQSAAACIQALQAAAGLRNEDSLLIHDSFLQAAPFVGRRTELETLETAVDELLRGKGNFFLLSGESGLGKSRLLREIRTYALIKGLPVLGEVASQDNEASYRIWDRILQFIRLNAEPQPQELAVLSQFFPASQKHIGTGQDEVSHFSEEVLHQTILSIIRRQPALLLILEDLQWASESLKILKQLAQAIHEIPVLIIGSYRENQAKALNQQFPEARQIKLKPLNAAEIQDLSSAITGNFELQKSQRLSWLSRESEGNPFFIIEIIRYLASLSGNINAIFEATQPENLLASGIQVLIEHRLSRLPRFIHELLCCLAVTGREYEEKFIEALNEKLNGKSFGPWYLLVSDAGVMEVEDNHWRFSHEKIRSYFLEKVAQSPERILIYEAAAMLAEEIYRSEPQWSETLAQLWRLAERADKELPYAIQSGINLFYINNIEASRTVLERAIQNLELFPDSLLKAKAAYTLAKNYKFLGDLKTAEAYYELGLQAAEEIQNKPELARFYSELARLALGQKQLKRAAECLEMALSLFQSEGLVARQKEILNLLAGLWIEKGDAQKALQYYEQAMALK